ncbi:D-TA family PLP-dependent enzyme [Chitinophaga alhagiae]|uniref:D-TA family PLP-dependent enzyme n=1 Tax=Chitinophaga alhagiae TaxID=2203219 RepID=UPI0018E4E2C0|nr:D-TA family PLP-dependent enzyme [Chitinophaga alhagiae]
MPQHSWYSLKDPGSTDSPALLLYPDRIASNIVSMISIAGNPGRLVPHVKTHKMSFLVKMQLEKGIRNFKCATIPEAEMLAQTGVDRVLLAYQLNEEKAARLLRLSERFNSIQFASLVDNLQSARMLNDLSKRNGLTANVYLDIDNGMHRTGFPVDGDVAALYQSLTCLSNIRVLGLHVYDGHIVDTAWWEREAHCNEAFVPVENAVEKIMEAGMSAPEIVAGGSPTFPFHARRGPVLCSPGTPLLWDMGYKLLLPDMPFLHAAVLLTRIISKPREGTVTTDLGYKSVSSENTIDKRVFFLNLNNYTVLSQDEEHLVVKVGNDDWAALKVGDVLYAVPFHICPTVSLYERTQVVLHKEIVCQWEVEARNRIVTI